MGEASRRKDLVESVRKKIGDHAAQALAALEQRVGQLQLQHQAFVFEIEGLRREVSVAKAAPAELRRDVLAFRGDLAMKAEQIEALGMRLVNLECRQTTLAATAERELTTAQNRINGRVNELWDAINAIDDQLVAVRDNAGTDARRVARLEGLTFRQRLRWLLAGRLPEPEDRSLHPLPYRADG